MARRRKSNKIAIIAAVAVLVVIAVFLALDWTVICPSQSRFEDIYEGKDYTVASVNLLGVKSLTASNSDDEQSITIYFCDDKDEADKIFDDLDGEDQDKDSDYALAKRGNCVAYGTKKAINTFKFILF